MVVGPTKNAISGFEVLGTRKSVEVGVNCLHKGVACVVWIVVVCFDVLDVLSFSCLIT